jgi:hypothetical protein
MNMNAVAPSSAPIAEGQDDFVTGEAAVQLVREKIIHVLTVFPRLSHSMLQVGIGTSMPPAIWRPILAQMIRAGEVVETPLTARTPHGRDQTYEILHLPVPVR